MECIPFDGSVHIVYISDCLRYIVGACFDAIIAYMSLLFCIALSHLVTAVKMTG